MNVPKTILAKHSVLLKDAKKNRDSLIFEGDKKTKIFTPSKDGTYVTVGVYPKNGQPAFFKELVIRKVIDFEFIDDDGKSRTGKVLTSPYLRGTIDYEEKAV